MEPIKIAIASSDGKNVNMHLGKASHFIIFQNEGNKVSCLELREKPVKIQKEHSDKWIHALEIMGDVKIFICSKIGPEPRREFEKRGITVIESDESISDAIINALHRYHCDDYKT